MVIPKAIKQYNDFFTKRKLFVLDHLENKIKKKISKKSIPNIAICCSGGGFKSMISTTGLISGMESIGLLDVTSHLATLSGSSWAITPWILQKTNINQYKNDLIFKCDKLSNLHLLKNLQNINVKNFKEIKSFFIETYLEFLKTKRIRYQYQQKISFIDTYGIILSYFLFKEFDNKFNLTLSDLAPQISDGQTPFPIFTAVTQLNNHKYEWLEFTPFYVGSKTLKNYIAAQNLGKTFNDGIIINDTPETSLSTLMGIFGSAFSASLKDAINKLATLKIPLKIESFLQKTENKIEYYEWTNKKISSAQIPNFSFQMQNSPIKSKPYLTVVDGAYLCNIPLIPLLEQNEKMDIIIILDNAKHKFIKPTHDLKISENIAKEKGYKFPPIDYKKAVTQNLSIFKDETDPECPIIIYIPLIKDESYSKSFDPQKAPFCKITNFFYSKNQARLLSELPEHVIKQHEKKIWDTIENKIIEKQIATEINKTL